MISKSPSPPLRDVVFCLICFHPLYLPALTQMYHPERLERMAWSLDSSLKNLSTTSTSVSYHFQGKACPIVQNREGKKKCIFFNRLQGDEIDIICYNST